MSSLTTDRLQVFVSSTIEECASERNAARCAIQSINHEPILFERIGARPHPPRDVYLARLEIAHIFVAIYKESYGWIAPDMSISGIEDEYRFATDRGIDRLIYIYGTPQSREPRLSDLLHEVKGSGITFAIYSDPTQLVEQLRDDLTAVISQRFEDQILGPSGSTQAKDLLETVLPEPSERFRRPELEARVVEALQDTGRLVVRAPIGGGKTVFLAQLSEQKNWLFVDGRDVTHLALVSRITNALRARLGKPPLTLTTRDAAERELGQTWDETPDTTVVVDDAAEPLAVWRMAGPDRRLVVSSRSRLAVPASCDFQIPPWTGKEIADWLGMVQATRPDPGEVSRLTLQSDGLPLYLRFYARHGGRPADLSIQEMELNAIDALAPEAKEITSYLALAPGTLSLGDLEVLLGGEGGPETVAAHIGAAAGLVTVVRGHVTLAHDHLRTTVLNQLQHDEARRVFFGRRLGQLFETTNRPLAAFHAYSRAGDGHRADALVEQAANQAILMGGGQAAIPVLRRQAEQARDRGATSKEVLSLLNLALAQQQTGAVDAATTVVQQASRVIQERGETELTLRLRETESILDIDDRPREARIEELMELRRQCAQGGDRFNAARTGTLLTAEYIAAGEYQLAEPIARAVQAEFEEIGDQYGTKLARLNLVSALSGIGGRENEASAIAQELVRDVRPDEYPRARALLCNVLTRHHRRLGDTDRASTFATEAIDIGEALQDKRVIAINRKNLGNLRRDEGRLDAALTEYHIADRVAAEAGLSDVGSDVNEVIASVHSERNEYPLAVHHAQHAASVARVVGDAVLVARAEEECAIALGGQRKWEHALDAYQRAIRAIGRKRERSSFVTDLLDDALKMCARAQRRDLKLKLLQTMLEVTDNTEPQTADPVDVVYQAVARMATYVVEGSRVIPTVALAMEDLWDDVPPLVGRRIVLGTVNALVERSEGSSSRGEIAAVAALLLLKGSELLRCEDVVDIGERVSSVVEGVYFKPHEHGEAHWTVRMDVGTRIVVSVVQLDEEPGTAVTTAALALLLFVLDRTLGEQLLGAKDFPRREATVNVVSRGVLEEQVGDRIEIPDMEDGYAVMESCDPTREEQPPIVVVCRGGFLQNWRPSKERVSEGHMLFGDVLIRLANHLLAGAIERRVLLPKAMRIVRTIGSRD